MEPAAGLEPALFALRGRRRSRPAPLALVVPRAGDRTRTCCLRFTGPVRRPWRLAGMRTLGRIRTGTVDVLTSCLYQLDHEGMSSQSHRPGPDRRVGVHPCPTRLRTLPVAPSRGFEPSDFPIQSRASCRWTTREWTGRGARAGRPRQRWARAAHDGAAGVTRSGMRASTGVRSPLRWLHGPHAATVFFQVLRPPRERGRTWSTVVAWPPQ
jgi:hypothetical protein